MAQVQFLLLACGRVLVSCPRSVVTYVNSLLSPGMIIECRCLGLRERVCKIFLAIRVIHVNFSLHSSKVQPRHYWRQMVFRSVITRYQLPLATHQIGRRQWQSGRSRHLFPPLVVGKRKLKGKLEKKIIWFMILSGIDFSKYLLANLCSK